MRACGTSSTGGSKMAIPGPQGLTKSLLVVTKITFLGSFSSNFSPHPPGAPSPLVAVPPHAPRAPTEVHPWAQFGLPPRCVCFWCLQASQGPRHQPIYCDHYGACYGGQKTSPSGPRVACKHQWHPPKGASKRWGHIWGPRRLLGEYGDTTTTGILPLMDGV